MKLHTMSNRVSIRNKRKGEARWTRSILRFFSKVCLLRLTSPSPQGRQYWDDKAALATGVEKEKAEEARSTVRSVEVKCRDQTAQHTWLVLACGRLLTAGGV